MMEIEEFKQRILRRNGWKPDERNMNFFWYKDFTVKNQTITMYIGYWMIRTSSEIELYRLMKDREERAKRYFLY